MNVVFMGSAEFGIPVLEKLSASEHKIVGIVSTPPRQKGRGLVPADSPVVHHARRNNLGPILLPEVLKSEEFIHALKELEADVFVVVAFRILPRAVFKLPRLGTLNIHASLLPRYRGPAPIQRAIEAGEKETGITIFRIDEGIDTGNVILSRSLAIGDEETTPQLYGRLARLGAENLNEALSILEKGADALSEQDPSKATGAPKLTKGEGKINWDRPARELFNMVRAFKPFPGTYAFLEGSRLNIEWALPLDASGNEFPGTICSVTTEGFDVQCLNSRLRIIDVKPEGKKVMSAKAFKIGRKITEGMRFQ